MFNNKRLKNIEENLSHLTTIEESMLRLEKNMKDLFQANVAMLKMLETIWIHIEDIDKIFMRAIEIVELQAVSIEKNKIGNGFFN